MEMTSRSFVLVVVFLLCIETSYCRYYTRQVKPSLRNPLTYGETDIVFVLDASGRVGRYNFVREVTFVRNLLNNINVYVDGAQVSLIRYDHDVDVLIHQIGGWTGNSKCELLPALSGVSYTGGQTHTGEALQKAREIFQSSRHGAKKVLVLLTGGYSNGNVSPGHQAALLRATGVEIFTIGIGSYDYSELQAIASTPYSVHVYQYNNFNDFNGLALQIRGDAHEVHYLYFHQHYCPQTCSSNADCTCETLSGAWWCHCREGFSGLSGQCAECPVGSYKSELGPASRCDLCPPHSTTRSTRSTSIGACFCMVGYYAVGTASNGGVNCEVVKCNSLQPYLNQIMQPTDGDFKYGDVFSFTCESGYQPADPNVPQTQQLQCVHDPGQSQGRWEGTRVACSRIQCGQLHAPAHGSISCNASNWYQSECRFACSLGYILNGSPIRNCQNDKQWTGTEAFCEAVTCARLTPQPHVVAYPSNCTMSKTSYLDSCIFSCKPGYSSTNGQTTLVTTCGASSIPGSSDGTWTEPIEGFICEGDITADNDPGLDSAEVTWTAPVATDTTGVTPVVLGSVTPPQRFTIGLHTLNYTAVDEAGLASSCYFQVEIRDITGPECVSCPEDINVFSSNREFAIQWDEPTWIDNSGNIAGVYRSHIPGSLFYWGAPQFVYYIARDNAGNTGFCNFTVTVKQHTCPYQAPPRNGALACDTWLGGQFCSVSCNRDFGFAREPESLYYCKQEEGGGRWSPFLPGFHEFIFPWPDCTGTSSPGVVGTFQVQYYTSDCAVDTEEIRQNFVAQAKMLNFLAEGFCMDEAECNIDNVHVSCGTSSTRGARNTHNFISVDFNLVVHTNESFSFNGSFVQAATAQIALFAVGIETTVANGAFNISVGNDTISTIPGSFSTAGDTVLMCSQGSVLKDSDCLSCPAGTFSNGTSCTDCPPGFYQDKEAQISCLPCLNGTTTYHPRAVSAEECKELCEDYTFFDETTNDCRNVSTTAAAEIGSHGCPPDTVPYSNSCYILLDESADYMTARKICESGGGYLVVVKDGGEHQFLIDHLNSTIDIWIGLDDIINEGTFMYNDGSPLGAFSKWATGEPNDAVGNQDCVHLWPLAGMTWDDTICTKEKRFVCEFEK